VDDLVRVREGQAAQQDGVHEREDGAVDPDAQAERQDGNQREPGVLHEHAEGVLQVHTGAIRRYLAICSASGG